ncbi:MAG: sfr [Actinomycetia bacterium]|jgi:rod shape determining protein RodA|nr:sfr [Actinomycetes bacterium]MDX6336480.1 rod shape determining protein RodA [Streptosporangiaceae bacterium]
MNLGTRDYTSPRSPSFGQKRRSLVLRAVAKDSPLRRYDWVLLAAVVALSLIGTLLVYSATQPSADPRSYLIKQLINVALGVILMVVVSLLDYRQIRLLAPFVYLAAVLGLLVVLSPLGSTVSGAKAWINLPAGFQVEPSEFAKIGLVLVIAVVFGELRDGGRVPGPKHAAGVLALAVIPVVLVEREPALGVLILLLLMTFGMIALSGLRLRWVAALTAAGLLAVVAVFQLHLLRSYQLDRLTSFLHPAADPTGTGYETIHSKIMIGSGGMFGTGLLHGPLVTASFVPNQQTDFIVSVAGEELGFVGCAVIILLLAVVIFRALRIAARADDQFGLLVASGIALWFGLQAFINIGMTIGIMPVTGLPLPFVSYGGSAMFADMIAVGVLQSVHRRHPVFR